MGPWLVSVFVLLELAMDTAPLPYHVGTWSGLPHYTCPCGYNTLNEPQITTHVATCQASVETDAPVTPAPQESPPVVKPPEAPDGEDDADAPLPASDEPDAEPAEVA